MHEFWVVLAGLNLFKSDNRNPSAKLRTVLLNQDEQKLQSSNFFLFYNYEKYSKWALIKSRRKNITQFLRLGHWDPKLLASGFIFSYFVRFVKFYLWSLFDCLKKMSFKIFGNLLKWVVRGSEFLFYKTGQPS